MQAKRPWPGWPAPGEDQPELSAADQLGQHLIRVAKLMRGARSELPRIHGADPMSYPLLFNLCGDAIRISALAERVHSEISTVSRSVSALERLDLVVRVPDPADGRAQLVTLTDHGRDALGQLQQARTQMFERLLRDWDDADVEKLIGYLVRFGDDLESLRDTTDNPSEEASV